MEVQGCLRRDSISFSLKGGPPGGAARPPPPTGLHPPPGTFSPAHLARAALLWLGSASLIGISPPRKEASLPNSPSVSYTFILLSETLASAAALTEKGRMAMENFITLNMAITLNACGQGAGSGRGEDGVRPGWPRLGSEVVGSQGQWLVWSACAFPGCVAAFTVPPAPPWTRRAAVSLAPALGGPGRGGRRREPSLPRRP